MVITLAAMAQTARQAQSRNRNDNQQPRALPSVEQEAQLRVDQMASEMPLTPKQIKKLLAYYKKDIQYRRDNFQMRGGPRPDGGRRPEKNGQRGPGMGQGQPPQGNPEMGAGTPPVGRPEGQDIDLEKLEKYNLKQDKKLRKIIGDDNFTRWRAAHPQQMPKLPGLNGSNH